METRREQADRMRATTRSLWKAVEAELEKLKGSWPLASAILDWGDAVARGEVAEFLALEEEQRQDPVGYQRRMDELLATCRQDAAQKHAAAVAEHAEQRAEFAGSEEVARA